MGNKEDCEIEDDAQDEEPEAFWREARVGYPEAVAPKARKRRVKKTIVQKSKLVLTIERFIKTEVDLVRGEYTPMKDVYRAWERFGYCPAKNNFEVTTPQVFSKTLRQMGFCVGQRGPRGHSVRCWKGFKLRGEAQPVSG